ncbi:MAG TPA: hypothetical protein VN947_21795 [Polyangia bacterium]|nr:hypothetical protein [Polyangia bacterium]
MRRALAARMSILAEAPLLLPNEEGRIAAAVAAAEACTRVEFHVCIETTSRYPTTRAYALLRASTARGGRRQRMLLYLLTEDRRCYVATDPVLRPLESTGAWRDVEHRLTLDVLHGKLGEALATAIHRFSLIAARHLPSDALD